MQIKYLKNTQNRETNIVSLIKLIKTNLYLKNKNHYLIKQR